MIRNHAAFEKLGVLVINIQYGVINKVVFFAIETSIEIEGQRKGDQWLYNSWKWICMHFVLVSFLSQELAAEA